MKNILLLFLIIGINEIYAQNKVQEIIEFNSLVDTLDNKTVKTFEYDQNGNLVKENYINFMPLNSKYRNIIKAKFKNLIKLTDQKETQFLSNTNTEGTRKK